MIAHSLWEQGRDLSSGQIVSMTPFNLPGGSGALGSIPLGGGPIGAVGMTLSAVAQFGIYCELRRMNLLKEAEFEERRHGWIDDISTQWLQEHSTGPGITRDVTEAVSIECLKMWDKVCENKKTDVPQSVLLRISRMADFLDRNYELIAAGSNQIVNISKSPKSWILSTEDNSKTIAESLVEEDAEENERIRGPWWRGPVKLVGGFPLFLIPWVGPFAAGGAWGSGLAQTIDFLKTRKLDFERVEDKIPLLRFGIAVERLDAAANQLSYLMEEQNFTTPVRLGVTESEEGKLDFLVDGFADNDGKGKDGVRFRRVRLPKQEED